PKEWRHQIKTLQRQADALASTAQWPGTLTEALEILQASLEDLHVAEEDMRQQHEAIVVAQQAMVVAHQRDQQVFDVDPAEQVITDHCGLIQQANQATAALLATSEERLVGKPLARRTGRSRVSSGYHHNRSTDPRGVTMHSPRFYETIQEAYRR